MNQPTANRQDIESSGGIIKPRHKNIFVTPKKAAQLLKKNKSNRRLRPRVVDSYSRDMAAGRWKLNAEPIIVSDDGTLNDGQHRLYACIKAGVGFWTTIAYGVAEDALETINTGKVRIASDMLKIANVAKHHVIVASVSKLMLVYEGIVAPTLSEIKAEVLTRLEEYEYMADLIVGARVSGQQSLFASSACGFCHMKFREKNKVEADFFIRRIIGGEALNRTNPEFTIRARAQRARNDRMSYRTDDQVTMIIKAWNAVRTKTRLTKIYPTGMGDTGQWRTIVIK